MEFTRKTAPAKIRVSREKRLDQKITALWSEHIAAVDQRLETADRKALDAIAKALCMPRHIRSALDWAFTRSMIGAFSSGETVARNKAYDQAYLWIQRKISAATTNVAEKSLWERRAAINEGACAGYLFAAFDAAQST